MGLGLPLGSMSGGFLLAAGKTKLDMSLWQHKSPRSKLIAWYCHTTIGAAMPQHENNTISTSPINSHNIKKHFSFIWAITTWTMVLNKQVSHKLADQNSKMAAGLPGQEEHLSPLLSTLFVLFVRDSCKNIVFIFNNDLLFEQTAYITYDSREDQVTVSYFMSANSEATVHRRGFPILHLLSLQLYLHDNCVAWLSTKTRMVSWTYPERDHWLKKHFRLDDEHDESWSDFDEDNCCFPVVLSVGSRVYRVSDATFYLWRHRCNGARRLFPCWAKPTWYELFKRCKFHTTLAKKNVWENLFGNWFNSAHVTHVNVRVVWESSSRKQGLAKKLCGCGRQHQRCLIWSFDLIWGVSMQLKSDM